MGQDGRRPARVLVGRLGSRLGDQVRVCGWVRTLRLQRRMQFVVLRDETGAVQLTNRREVRPDLDERLDALTVGSAVALTGRVVEAPQVKLGGIEVLVDSVDLVSTAEQPLPIAETSSPDLRLDWRFLDLRASRQHLTFKIGSLMEVGPVFRAQLHLPALDRVHRARPGDGLDRLGRRRDAHGGGAARPRHRRRARRPRARDRGGLRGRPGGPADAVPAHDPGRGARAAAPGRLDAGRPGLGGPRRRG
jgi:hypothetical protein